jgi:processive 1,2-diacylglycerol beta-glucosyltransferase/1,2-diacylglycerol 3-beta-galactosyltransferase
MNTTKKKFLFLYLKTGGGHLAPAKSIAEYFEKYKSDEVETILYDGFESSQKIAKLIVVDGYRILQSKAIWLYELIYAIHKIKIVSIISSWIVSEFVVRQLEKKIEKENPDKIIIFHFFMIEPTYHILRKKKLSIPIITIVTDPFTAHPLWLLNKKQKFILFSEELKTKCINSGIDPSAIKVLPFPLQERFSISPTSEQIKNYKRELGFLSEKVLLILGGGDGIPKGISILKSLCNQPINYKIVFVCGNNKELFTNVMRFKERYNYSFLKVFGFTNTISELINISNAVITKCGASTIMEIIISNKIPIVNSYIWEQEKGNVEFLVENKLGIYEKKIAKLPNLVEQIFSNENYLRNKSTVKIENGTSKISDYLLQ